MDAGQTVPGFYKEGPDKAEFFVHSPFAWRLNEREIEDRNQDSIVMQVTFVEGGVETYGILGSDADYDTLTKIVEIAKLHKREAPPAVGLSQAVSSLLVSVARPRARQRRDRGRAGGAMVVRDAEPRRLRYRFDQRPHP